jgi:hypothetical protein
MRAFSCWDATHIILVKPVTVKNSTWYESKRVKGKGVPIHTMKACRRSGSIALVILSLSTRWRYV